MTAPIADPATPATDPAGATPPDPAATAAPAAEPADKPLGPGGERALAAEREARKALEKQLAELSPLKDLAKALTGGAEPADGKTELQVLQERLTNHEQELGQERSARWRAEVAHQAGLTPEQAARLVGTTRDELLADAEALKALFPAAAPGTPRPDPTQGPRGGQTTPDLQAQIDAAKSRGDMRTAISLERTKLLNIQRPS